jgi:hypothetical protein
MKLTNPETENQSVKKMEDGQIAILTGAYKDTKVQRHHKHLIGLGHKEGHSWTNYFETHNTGNLQCRILENGESLTVTNN